MIIRYEQILFLKECVNTEREKCAKLIEWLGDLECHRENVAAIQRQMDMCDKALRSFDAVLQMGCAQ